MKGEINVVETLVKAVSILNNLDEYLESLDNGLSECDSLISDYEHFIENMEVEKTNLKTLFLNMKAIFKKRRIIKCDMALRENYKKLSMRLNNSTNREFLIQDIKSSESKLGSKYHNRILKEADLKSLSLENKPKRGRPKKEVTVNEQ